MKPKYCPICKHKLKGAPDLEFYYCINCKSYGEIGFTKLTKNIAQELKRRYGFPKKDLKKMGFDLKENEYFYMGTCSVRKKEESNE